MLTTARNTPRGGKIMATVDMRQASQQRTRRGVTTSGCVCVWGGVSFRDTRSTLQAWRLSDGPPTISRISARRPCASIAKGVRP